jgi:hypothetical protein
MASRRPGLSAVPAGQPPRSARTAHKARYDARQDLERAEDEARTVVRAGRQGAENSFSAKPH